MDCQTATEHLGAFVDDELPPDLRETLATHVDGCERCRSELEALRRLTARLAAPVAGSPPPELWDAIAGRLDQVAPAGRIRHGHFTLARSVALAASVALFVGAGALVTSLIGPGSSTVEAATIDFSLLLDGLPADVDAAVGRFLAYYHASPIARHDAHDFAPALAFAVPRELPGGFHLEQTYGLLFKDKPGIAARYTRNGELLMTLVHPPIRRVDLGTYRDAPCIIGERHGHQVEVGPWRLVHLKEPTTCHCVLSKLNRPTELAAVLAAIAPDYKPAAPQH